MPRTIDLADLQLDIPDKPRHKWGDHDPEKDDSDRVVLRHDPTRTEVTLNARDFGAHTLTHGIADLVGQISRQK